MFYLDRYRKQIGGRFSGFLLLSIVLSFAFWGVSNYFTTPRKGSKPTYVNGQMIQPDRVRLFYDQYRAKYNKKNQFTKNELNNLFEKFLSDKGILTYAYQHGFDFSPNLIASKLVKEAEQYYHQRLDVSSYKQLQSKSPFSEGARLDSIQDQLMQDYLLNGIEKTNFILPEEWKHWHQYLGQSREIMYARLHPDSFIHAVKINPKKVLTYYQQHHSDFMQQERVKLAYIVFRPVNIQNTLHPSEKVLYDFYLKHDTFHGNPQYQVNLNYLIPGPEKMSEQDLAAFTTHTSDPNFNTFILKHEKKIQLKKHFKKKWLALSELPNVFHKQLGSGLPPGTHLLMQDSKHPDQWYQLSVLAIKRNLRAHYDHNRARIKRAWMQEEVTQQFAQRLDEIADWSFEHNGDLSKTAEQFHLKLKTSPWLEKGQLDQSSIFYQNDIQKLIFSDDFIHNQWTSEPKTLTSGAVILFHLIDHQSPKVKPFSTVQAQIVTHLKQLRSKQYVHHLKDKFLEAFKEHQPIDQMVHDLHLSWKTKTVYAYSLLESSHIKNTTAYWLSQFAFKLPANNGSAQVFELPLHDDGVYWVVALKQINMPVNDSSPSGSLDRFKKYLQQLWGQIDLNRYGRYALQHATFRFD